jgi:multidrug efflux pump subunit AcrA (membrane-fusion protein)
MFPSSRRRFLKPVLVVATIVVIAGRSRLAHDAGEEGRAQGPAKVVLEFTPADVAVVEMRELQRTLSLSGSLSPVLQATVRSKVPGEVQKVLVREGDRVAEGR